MRKWQKCRRKKLLFVFSWSNNHIELWVSSLSSSSHRGIACAQWRKLYRKLLLLCSILLSPRRSSLTFPQELWWSYYVILTFRVGGKKSRQWSSRTFFSISISLFHTGFVGFRLCWRKVKESLRENATNSLTLLLTVIQLLLDCPQIPRNSVVHQKERKQRKLAEQGKRPPRVSSLGLS